MPKSEEIDIEKYRFIIYHGHIHILSKSNEVQEFKDLDDKEVPNL